MVAPGSTTAPPRGRREERPRRPGASAPRLTTAQGTALALSATAPWYSIMVTAPLIAALVGSGTAAVYLLAAIPAALVAAGMSANDRRDPHKGSVYAWVRHRLPRTGWLAGFCLASTGIIATSGMAHVAADLLIPSAPAALKAGLAAALTGVAALIDLYELRLMAALQYLAIVAGVGATIVCAGLVAGGGVRLAPMAGSPLAWFHAVLLAVFAYWGFDAIFALTEVTSAGAPQRVTALTVVGLIGFFAVGGTAYSAVDPTPVTGHLVVRIAVVSSAMMSLGSTLVPTARGIEAMADAGQIPSWAGLLRRTSWATAVVTTASVAWAGLLLISEGLFTDTVDALSVLVGLYFTASSLIAALRARSQRERWAQVAAVALMVVITTAVAIQMLDPAYGATAVGGVGGVGLIVVGLSALGVAGALRYGGPESGARGGAR
ncbi:APC family permease [Actinomyces marmotae]|uniref:APC family permease n=1 Tax=Actinomyces marmotae TaxID=2737173 RepID=UPI001F22A57A|nr:APC family permease [Actinomyces marmotae]